MRLHPLLVADILGYVGIEYGTRLRRSTGRTLYHCYTLLTVVMALVNTNKDLVKIVGNIPSRSILCRPLRPRSTREKALSEGAGFIFCHVATF